MKENENQYYKSLLLTKADKKKIFNIECEEDVLEKRPPKIIAQDPFEGNLIMTEEEFKIRYSN